MKSLPDQDNEKLRLEALRAYHILDTIEDEAYDRLTKLASIICDVPIALVSLIDEKRQWFKSRTGLPIRETPREYSFCQHAILQTSLFQIEDAIEDERFKDNPLVTGDPNIRFYAGYPLIDSKGIALGTLCVIDRKPKKLSPAQKEALQLLSEEVMTLIVEKRKKEEFENFERLFELSNDLISIAGSDGFLKRINLAFETLLGWDRKFLLESPFIDLVHPDDLANTRTVIQHLLESGQPVYFSNRIRTKSGEYKTLQWAGTPEASTGNLFSIARDITADKKKEVQLQVSENRFRSFFENSQGLMCTHDLQGKFLSVNSSGAALLGYTTAEIMQKSLFDIVPVKHHPNLKAYLEIINKEGKFSGVMTTLHKDGSLRGWLFNNIIEKDIEGSKYVIGNSIDITERMRLEKDLLYTKQLLEQTSHIARVGAWEMILAKQKTYWSALTKEIHQVPDDYEPDLATAIEFYKEGESRNKIKLAVKEAIENGTEWDLELQIVTGKGNERWVRAQGKAEIENGVCKRLYGAFQDIDEQKRTKLELETNENKYRAFFDISPVGIAINRHSDGKFIDGNQALYQMIGYTEEEYRRLTHWDVTPAKFDDEEIKHRNSLTINGRYGPYEKIYIHKDGHAIPVLLNGIKFMGPDGEEQVYSVIQDISERKQAEKALIIEKSRLSAFVEHAPAAVAMFDLGIHYIAASNRWLEEYHLQGRNIIGLSHYEVFPNIDNAWKEIHQRCLQGAVERKDEDVWRPDGWEKDQYLRWEVRPWYLYDGSIGGIMMFTQDITEICLQREELKKAKLLAEQASLAKSEFLASMSHEIRTPLNGVIGFTDLILKTHLDQTQQQYLNIVNQSANTLLSIINDILDFSKIEAGKMELENEKCDLYEIAGQAADMISFQVEKKELEMLLNISTELPRFIWTDSVRLKQILINLLSNASKFTEHGEIELKIEPLSDTSQNEVLIRFEVKDTGIGIRPDKQEKIFQAFSQEDGSVTRKYGGTGLGLTISNRLLAMMGSKLQLESSPGRGSRFYFDLKLTAEQGQADRWEDVSNIKKVLIVDDNGHNRTILVQMLLLQNIHADIAKNGIEALQILETGKKYDVILTDYHMPIMDGLETIQKIRENFYATKEQQPIMLLSSSSGDEYMIKRCLELQVSGRLTKPIKMQDLYSALARMVGQTKGLEKVVTEDIQVVNEDKLRIIIAEDGPVNMLLAKIIILRIAPNAEIIEALNGKIAVQLCIEQMPDFIFMDIQMPEMNGYEATRKIRLLENGKQIPIVALTAGVVEGEREKCIEAGMNDFIAKPVVEDTVKMILRKWILPVADLISPVDAEMNESNIREHLDMHKLLEIAGDDKTVLRSFLASIESELGKSDIELGKSFLQKDLEGLRRDGHKLKGTSLATGMDRLSEIAKSLELLAEFDENHISGILKAFRKEKEKLMRIIKKESEK